MGDNRKEAFEEFGRAAEELAKAGGFKEAVKEWEKDRQVEDSLPDPPKQADKGE